MASSPATGACAARRSGWCAVARVDVGTTVFVHQGQPKKNFQGREVLRLNGGSGTDDRQAFLHISRPFNRGATILSAYLEVYLGDNWSTGTASRITVRRVLGKWSAGEITWDKRPPVASTGQITSQELGGVKQAMRRIDVTQLFQDVADGADYFGLRLELSNNQNRRIFSNRAAAKFRPRLAIVYSTPPDAPDSLRPNNEAVGVAKPMLRWVFEDRGVGSVAQAFSQVQISSVPSFTAPAYDSAKQANIRNSWNLADTAAAALTPSVTYYWRVRVWDETNLASAWSDPVPFTYEPYGTLTLIAPDAPPNNKVSDLTAPISWNFTGRTQREYAAYVFELLEPTGTPFLRQEVAAASTNARSFNIHEGILKSGRTFQVQLQVWDTIDRTTSPGDPGYLEILREFTYERSGVPAPVTSLAAEVGDQAFVALVWERAEEPDYFCLRVDGVEEVPRIEPADVWVSGDTYRYLYWGAVPRRLHAYEVEAVVRQTPGDTFEHSDGNATLSARSTPIGITLVDPRDSTYVVIYDNEEADLTIGETAETYDPIGSRRPVRITSSIRGYEGSVSGVFLDGASRTRFVDLKERLQSLRIVLGDLNLPVFLEETNVAPHPTPGDQLYPVELTFFQTGEFEEISE